MKIIYAILAYNNSIHSVTKLKPIDIINGHINNENPFNIEIDKILINDYINEHKERIKLMFSKINENIRNSKDKIITRLNEIRDDPALFQPQAQVYVKKHIRQKTSNKFQQPTVLTTVDEVKDRIYPRTC